MKFYVPLPLKEADFAKGISPLTQPGITLPYLTSMHSAMIMAKSNSYGGGSIAAIAVVEANADAVYAPQSKGEMTVSLQDVQCLKMYMKNAEIGDTEITMNHMTNEQGGFNVDAARKLYVILNKPELHKDRDFVLREVEGPGVSVAFLCSPLMVKMQNVFWDKATKDVALSKAAKEAFFRVSQEAYQLNVSDSERDRIHKAIVRGVDYIDTNNKYNPSFSMSNALFKESVEYLNTFQQACTEMKNDNIDNYLTAACVDLPPELTDKVKSMFLINLDSMENASSFEQYTMVMYNTVQSILNKTNDIQTIQALNKLSQDIERDINELTLDYDNEELDNDEVGDKE